MRLLTFPRRLTYASSCLFLSVPLTLIQGFLIANQPWWRTPYLALLPWGIFALALSLPLTWFLMRGSKWAYRVTLLCVAIWVLVSIFLSFSHRSTSLGFYTLFIAVAMATVCFWVEYEMKTSFLNSGTRWYQRFPRSIPGLSCEWADGEQKIEARVSQLDLSGAFIFGGFSKVHTNVRKVSELTFKFRDQHIKCEATPVSALDAQDGIGFQFRNLSLDQLKLLGDFVERLKGEGHA